MGSQSDAMLCGGVHSWRHPTYLSGAATPTSSILRRVGAHIFKKFLNYITNCTQATFKNEETASPHNSFIKGSNKVFSLPLANNKNNAHKD